MEHGIRGSDPFLAFSIFTGVSEKLVLRALAASWGGLPRFNRDLLRPSRGWRLLLFPNSVGQKPLIRVEIEAGDEAEKPKALP